MEDIGLDLTGYQGLDTPVGLEPKTFQMEGAKESIRCIRYGIYDETGVGKTITIFLTLLAWHLLGNKVVFMTKIGLFNQILTEWEEFFPGLDVKPENELGADIMLASHESLRVKRYTQAYIKDYTVFVIDEFHKMSKPDGRRFKILEMVSINKAVMPLTGTPVGKDPINCYSLIALTNPRAYKDFNAYKRQHVVYKKMGRGESSINILDGFKNLEQVKKRLYGNARRIKKADAWKGLGKPIWSKRVMSLTDSQESVYRDFQEFLIFENSEGDLFDASYTPTLKFQKGISSITNPAQYEKGATSCILEDIRALAEEVCVDNKLIVFTMYATTAEHYAEELKDYNPALITGSVKEDVKFKNMDSCKICIITFGAGAEGYSFQRVCSYLYLAEYMPIPGMITQAVNRIHRPPQIQVPSIYIPHVLNTTYTENLIVKLKKRNGINNEIIDTYLDI